MEKRITVLVLGTILALTSVATIGPVPDALRSPGSSAMTIRSAFEKITNQRIMNTVEINDKNLDTIILNRQKTVLIDFSAEWCGPCKMMTPVVDLLAERLRDKAIIGKLDVDANPDSAAKYGLRSMPTFLIFKNGLIVDRVVGAVPGKILEEKILAASSSGSDAAEP